MYKKADMNSTMLLCYASVMISVCLVVRNFTMFNACFRLGKGNWAC